MGSIRHCTVMACGTNSEESDYDVVLGEVNEDLSFCIFEFERGLL